MTTAFVINAVNPGQGYDIGPHSDNPVSRDLAEIFSIPIKYLTATVILCVS